MSALSQRGRLGSGLGAQQVARGVGDIAANMSFADYSNERSPDNRRRLSLLLSLHKLITYDIGQLANVGAAREQQAQRGIQDAITRYQYEQNAPMQYLAQYQNLVAGFPTGTTQTQITPYYEPSTGQKFLGGAASLAGALGNNASFGEKATAGFLGGLLGMG
jgi:hypothetical protein